MSGLNGKKVVLTGTRRLEEISSLVESRGGIPLIRSTQGQVCPTEKELEPYIHRLIQGDYDWVVLTTGSGTETILKVAETLGLGEEVKTALRRTKIALRGYKTQNVVKSLGLAPLIRDEDGTTTNLIKTLASHHLKGKRIAIQLYGEPIPELNEFLEKEKVQYDELYPYRYLTPDPGVLDTLVKEILECEVQGVALTSAVQVRNLFHHGQEQGLSDQLVKAFNEQVVAGVVGKVTAETLQEAGVSRMVKPDRERMGAMIMAMDRFFKEKSTYI